jgi:adenylate kinase
MNLVLLGPPGAGKGTVAKKLAEKYGIPHISTGDLFRAAISQETELGLKVKEILAEGGLVPDDLTIGLVKERFAEGDVKSGFILDGFPRTIPQAQGLEGLTRLDGVINFELSDEEVVKRLSGRRIAKKSGRIYHIIFNPPKQEGIDDETGEELITRPDDQEDAVRRRLEVYKKETAPLIDYYTKKGLLVSIDASPPPGDVMRSVEEESGLLGGK